MDLTPPGQPAEGHIYFNDPTGETITVYKDSNTAVSKKPGGETVAFATLEGLISYLASKPSKLTSANSLSQAEMDIITDMVKSYGFKPNIDYIGPKATGTPFLAILDKAGQVRFTVRKLSNKFFCYKMVYKPNVVKGTPESVVHQGDWNTLIKELHVQLSTLAQPTMTVPSKDENVLSQTEMMAIAKLAKNYMLGTTQPIVTAIDHPSIIIQGNMGSNIWEVRKSKGKYEVFNIINPQHLENVIDEPTFAEMLLKLNKLFEKYMTEPQKPEKMGVFEFSPQEANDLGNLASQFGLLTKGITMTLEPDKHKVAGIEIIKPDGKAVFHVHKDDGTYSIFKVFDNGAGSKTWDNWYQGQNANAFFQQLTIYLHGHTPGEPQPAEHNGITPEEAEQIKMEVEQYGSKFWTEYVKGSMGQTAYVEVFYKAEGNAPAYLVFSVGALGNYYQINDSQNKPKENSPTFEGIVARIHDRLAELSGQKSEPHQVSVPHKLLDEEQTEIAKIISKYAPSLTYQLTPGDAMVIWVGNHITSYKVAKEEDLYRVYTDKDSEWVIQHQVSTLPELLAYLDDLLAHIAKALANTKLGQPTPTTTPSSNSEMLSASELAALKELIKKFKLPMQTSYTKKLMESENKQEAYSLTVADVPHKVFIRITKKEGLYIFSKGITDDYYPLKKFAQFNDLLAYTDYFFNSYLKPEPTQVEKITDEEVSMLKDLVKKYKVNGKVRRKYMTSSGQKVPYVFIELDDIGMKDYAIAKTAKGAYKLFEVDTLFEDWKNVAITDTWEGIYDIIGKVLNDEPIPDATKKAFPPVLDADQFEWLETLMKTKKPGVFVKQWGNGSIGGYDPSVKINGESNPLFVIRFAEGSTDKRILQVQTEDGGMAADEYPFNTFDGLAHFIVTNLEVVTQLLKGEVAPEGKLAELMNKNGFKFHHEKTNVEIDGVNKDANIYENDNNDRIYIFSDGGSRVWYMDKAVGDVISKDFKTIPELVSWMETNYEGKPSAELNEIQEYLAYLDFKVEGKKSDKFSTMWVKTFGEAHQPGYDHVHLHADGTSKVSPSSLVGEKINKSSAFFFNTVPALKQYLTEKYVKGKNYAAGYLKQILKEGKFWKVKDEQTEMGFLWQSKNLIVVPFPSGGIMRTMLGVEPKLDFSFESTYDLAKRVELFLDGNTEAADSGWTTGYSELNDLINKAGFKYQGQEETEHGPKLIFLDSGGIRLQYYAQEESASIKFPPSSGQGEKGIGFTTVEDLIDHLKKYNEKPEATDTFAKNAGYAGLLQTLAKHEFKYTHVKPDPELQPFKGFKRPDGAMVTIWDTGVCSYRAASDKAEWEYSKSFAELDDKLKKLYEQSQPPQGDAGPMYYPDKKLVDLIQSKGFKPEMLVYGTSWVHPSKFHFELHEKAIVWHAEKSSKEFGILKADHFDFLNKALAKADVTMDDEQMDQLFSAQTSDPQEDLFEKLIDNAAGNEGDDMGSSDIGNTLESMGFEWYMEERCWVHNKLMQVIVANPKESAQSLYRFWWLEGMEPKQDEALNETQLLEWVGPNGKIAKQQQETKAIMSAAFTNIQGVESPPGIHERFLQRGFIYDSSLKGYYKKYAENPGMLWTLVKWDGDKYYVSRPYVVNAGNITHKEFTSQDPYYVLNTIHKIENADFMDLVQSEEDALKKKDANYFNAPNAWTPYNPYSPKKHPGNIKPEDWIHKELEGYGFEWKPDGAMYYWVDLDGKIGTNWQAVRFDKNGTIVYFYHDKIGNPRYFCSKDFNEVQHKIEVHHMTADLFKAGGTSAGTVPPKQYPLDAKNYPTAPDWDKNFSQQGNAITLNPADHKAVLEVGFKFSVADGTYSNLKTKDQFKIFSNGFAWYKMTGIGEGMDNNLEHFFDMLKSKYGPLEWGFHPLTGHEVIQIKDKFDKLGFEAVEHPEAADDLYFERYPTDGVSSTNVKEVAVVFPNHTMNFYLYDATSKDKLLGVSEFESLSYGIHALEDFKHLIKLHLAHDLEPELTSHGFAYVPDKLRYEHVLGNGGLKIYINFFGNGQAKAQLMEPDSSTSDGHEEVKEKTFMSFYDAILWAAHKNFEIEPQPPMPVSKKEVAKAMKDLGFKDQGHLSPDVVTYNTSLGKVINVNLKNGKVDYSFQYVADDTTGELKWGKSTFYNWPVFMDFLKGTTKVKPTTGKLTYTPHPATKALPKMVPPGQGPPIQGKIQPPEKSVPGMPFSDFNYEGWAKGTQHNPKSTIKLVNNDDLLMHQIGFHSKQTDNNAYYYHNNKGDVVYFFVDGHAQIIPKDSTPITLPKVKMAISMLWAQHHEDKKASQPSTPEAPQNKFDVTEELVDLGFHPLASSGDELIYEKKDKKITHLVRWNKSENTIDYTAHKSGDSSVVTASWKEDAGVGLAHLAHIFTPKLTEQEFVVAKMEELGFKVLGGKPPEGAQSNTITFIRYTPKFVYDVIYHVDQKMMEFIKSNAKIKKGYHKIVEQWTLNVPDTIGKLENLFAFGSLGTIPAPTPKVPLVHVSIALPPDKEELLKSIGFHRLENNGVIWYEKAGEGQWVMFYKDGHATIKDKITGTEVDYFDTASSAIKSLASKYFNTSKKKPKATGEMPYSGTNYKIDFSKAPSGVDGDKVSIKLVDEDEKTMTSMGFHYVYNPDETEEYRSSYVKSEETVYFYANDTAEYRDISDVDDKGHEISKVFNSIKEAMEFVWNKHMPFIEESFFKDLVEVLTSQPQAAAWLMGSASP